MSTIFHLYVICIPQYHCNVCYIKMDFSACVHDEMCTRKNKIGRGCSKIFVCFYFLCPSHHFSVKSGHVLLSSTSSKQPIKCLAQGLNTLTSPAIRLKLATLLSLVTLPSELLHSTVVARNNGKQLQPSKFFHLSAITTRCKK